jgi:hypothetical protein
MKQRGGTPPDKSPGNPRGFFIPTHSYISYRYELVCSMLHRDYFRSETCVVFQTWNWSWASRRLPSRSYDLPKLRYVLFCPCIRLIGLAEWLLKIGRYVLKYPIASNRLKGYY